MTGLILKRSPLGPDQNQEDYDVPADGMIVGRIFFTEAAFEGRQWVWTLAYGLYEDRTPTHGHEPTREAAMAAFAKSWRLRSGGPLSNRKFVHPEPFRF